MSKKNLILCLSFIAILMVLILPVKADISLSDSTYFYDPLGDANGWSFEGDPNGWSTNNGGARSSVRHLDGSWSWYTSGGGDYYMWRYIDSSHALNAIKGKKVKFSFQFYPEVIIPNPGFETGASPWVTGGYGDHFVSLEEIHTGANAMLLGFKYAGNVANARDWAYQTITIPSTVGSAKFSFWYKLFTEDMVDWNWFEVYIRDASGNNLALVFKRGGVDFPGLEAYGWEYVTFDLTPYKGQTIQLYFAVANMVDTLYKTWVYVDDVIYQNDARAEVYYEYATGGGGGGGGCPYISTWNGMQYLLDNNLMPSSESTAGDVVDHYLLQQPLVPDIDGLYRLMLSEFEDERSFFDHIQLLAVGHSSNVNVAVSPQGQILTYTSPSPPISAKDDNSTQVKNLLSSIDGNYYEGRSGSYITLNFGDKLDISQGAKLVLRTDMKLLMSIYIQVQDVKNNWNTVALVTPRRHWSTDIIDMSNYLPDAKGSLKVRLYFTANHKVDFVGLDTSPQTTTMIQEAELISANHFKNADPTVYGVPVRNEVKSELIENDNASAELMPGEQIQLSFNLSNTLSGSVRDFVLVSKGRYETLPPGIIIDPTVYGSWIAPTDYEWTEARAIVDLPSTTTLVKVIIHGATDFRAYIDNAIFTITDIKQKPDSQGNLAIITDIVSWRIDPVTYGAEVKAMIGLAAYPNSNYKIRTVKLQTQLVPNNQDAKLHIDYVGQANDAGHQVDPAAVEEQRYFVLNVISTVVAGAAGTAAGTVVGALFPPGAPFAAIFVAKVFAGITTSTTVKYALSHFASDPDNTDAGAGYPNSAVWEEWPYPTYKKEYVTWAFVSTASGHYDLSWKFNRNSADVFQITTTAWVNWGISTYHPGNPQVGIGYYTLDDAGWTQDSMTFTVYA